MWVSHRLVESSFFWILFHRHMSYPSTCQNRSPKQKFNNYSEREMWRLASSASAPLSNSTQLFLLLSFKMHLFLFMQTEEHQSAQRSIAPFLNTKRCHCRSRLSYLNFPRADKSIKDITLKNINIMASYMHHCRFLKRKMGFQTSEQGSDNSL